MDATIVDQSSWDLVEVTGSDRVRFFQGMVIGNAEALEAAGDGGWIRTAMLNVKGRVMSVFDIARRGDAFLLICDPGDGERTVALLSKYAIVDDVEFKPVELAVHRLWSDPAAVWTAPPVFTAPPAPGSSPEQIEIRRVEAGLPRYGVDVTDKNFPFESPLADLIDYEKGCYIGQEPVHRVHAKGQAQKVLRGLAFDRGAPPEAGARVSHPARDNAGTVTSAVESPDFGTIALAYLHRTAAEPGSTVSCDGREATVVELPFSAD